MKVAGVVLAAGMGRRLAPLTDYIPKPLLPVLDRTLLEHQIERLEAAGAEQIFVNLHHHAAKVAHHLEQTAPQVVHRVEAELTGPAGALSLFADELTAYDAVLVASTDVLVGDDLAALLAAYVQDGAALTFGAVNTAEARRFGVLDVDANGAVIAAREKPDVPDDEVHLVSAGVYCLRPDAIEEVVRLAGQVATVDYASELTPALLEAELLVTTYQLDGYWCDVGTSAALSIANRDALEGKIPWLRGARPGFRNAGGQTPAFIHLNAVIESGVTLEGPAIVGAGARVGAAAHIASAVVLPGAMVPAHSIIVGGIIGATSYLNREASTPPVGA